MYQSLFFNKFAGLRPTTLVKERLWHRFFPVNFVKFLKTPFLQQISGRLLLYILVLMMRSIVLRGFEIKKKWKGNTKNKESTL